MGLETVTHISDLVVTNPVGSTDLIQYGDDHIRNIKVALKTDFPNITGAMTCTQTELNILDGATLSTAELNVLDGYTGNTADLNILAGAAAGGLTAAELLYIATLTSNAQTQLNLIGLHYLDVKTASSSSSLDFTSSIDGTYGAYLFWIQNLVPATDATDLYFRVSTDGGSTYVASANAYYYNAAIGATYFPLASPVSNTANRGGVSGYVIIYNPSSSSIKKQIHGNNVVYASSAGANTYATDNTRGVYDAITAVNAVRFIQSSGNLASGKIIMYGLKG